MMSDPAGHAAASASAAAASKRRLRRVADTSRKRSVQSCDFCRKRRCKCVPQPVGDGCLMCHSQGVACSYTLPRKARFYGSVDDLSDRFKCLEAIVRGAFPDDSIATVPDLLKLGERLGVSMPNLDGDARTKLSLEDLVNTPSKSVTSDQTTAVESERGGASSVADGPVHSTPGSVDSRLRTNVNTEPVSADTVNTNNTGTTHHTNNSTTDGTTSTNPQDESNESSEAIGLVRDTTGQEHFIGSSGSLQFLGQLRRLLLLSQHDNLSRNNTYHGYTGPGRASQRLTTTFTEEDAAQALEADNSQEGESVPAHHTGTPLMDERPSPMSISSALAREYVTIQPEDVEGIVTQLPPRHVLDALIRVYFKHVHPDFPLFHRGTFEEEYERYIPKNPHHPSSQSRESYYHPRNSGRTDSTTADPGWLGCLHMIIAFASLVSPPISSTAPPPQRRQSTTTPSTVASSAQHDDVDLAALRKHCVSLTRFRLLPHFISRCTLPNIRALLLLALYLHNHNERNAAWNLVGTATRAAFAMGLHRCTVGAEQLRPVEREVRRRVFCTLFGLEQFLASSLGRPSGLSAFSSVNDSNEVEIVPPRAEILDGGGSADDDDDGAVSTLLLKLQTILAKARVSAAVKTVGLPGPSGGSSGSRLIRQEKSAREIVKHLDDWRSAVSDYRFLNIPQITELTDGTRDFFTSPSSSTVDLDNLKNMLAWQSRPRLRAALVLHMQYRYVAVLSTRSSLLYSMASRTAPSVPREDNPSPSTSGTPPALADLCVQNAVQLCRLVLLADSFGLINGISAMDVFYAYCAAMVLILRSLNGGNDASGEDSYCAELRKLIARTRQVLVRVDKCSTMKRFSRVVATFEEGSKRAGQTENASANGNATHNPTHLRRDMPSPSPYARAPPRHTPVHTHASLHTPSAHTPSHPRLASLSTSLHVDDSQRFMAPSQSMPAPQAPFGTPGVNMYSGYEQGYGHGHPHSSGMPLSGQIAASQPSLMSLFDGEPEENQWVMDTFLGMGMGIGMGMAPGSGGSVDGDIDGAFSAAGMLDWPDMDQIMRNG